MESLAECKGEDAGVRLRSRRGHGGSVDRSGEAVGALEKEHAGVLGPGVVDEEGTADSGGPEVCVGEGDRIVLRCDVGDGYGGRGENGGCEDNGGGVDNREAALDSGGVHFNEGILAG